MKLTPFSAAVPTADLETLRFRLRDTRWPDEISDSGWTSGTNLTYLFIAHLWHKLMTGLGYTLSRFSASYFKRKGTVVIHTNSRLDFSSGIGYIKLCI